MSTITFESLAAASPADLDALMTTRPAPELADVVGLECRGWNLQKTTELIRTRKFIKGFIGDAAVTLAFGYNKPVTQNGLHQPWTPILRNGHEVQYLPFAVLPGTQVADAVYPRALVVDYRRWPGAFPLNPVTRTVDYLIVPDPSNPRLLVGKSYSHLLGMRLFLGFFILERLRPVPTDLSPAGDALPSGAVTPSVGVLDRVLEALIALQLTAIETSLGDSQGRVDDPAAVRDEVIEHLRHLPPVVGFGCWAALATINTTANLVYWRAFWALRPGDQRKVLDRLKRDLVSSNLVSILSRVTWLVIYSREKPRHRIAFTLPQLPTPVPYPEPDGTIPLDKEYEICIVGSGAGASVVAADVAATTDVLMVEEGRWIDPQYYPTRDDEALRHLFRDAGVQPAFPVPPKKTGQEPVGLMTVLQGRVVGGGPAVNNAIHLRLEHDRWKQWRTYDFPIAWDKLNTSLDRVATDLGVKAMPRATLGARSLAFATCATAHGELVEDLPLSVCDCLGCGGCNVGCRFARKIGGLHGTPPGQATSYLVKALRAGAKLRAGMKAVRVELTPDGRRATAIVCTDLLNGMKEERIRAKVFVLSAGSLASSRLLRASGIHAAGKQFAANIVTYVLASFPTPFPPSQSNPGIQMCLWVNENGRLFETWFHYPGSLAASLPGWLEENATVMTQYARLAGCGVVIPSDNRGYLDWADNLVLSLSPAEFDRMRSGIIKLAEMYIAGGATHVYPCTIDPFVFRASHLQEDTRAFTKRIRGPADLALGTSHLQGGNPIAKDRKHGIVSENFSVFGIANLFVADASVFPAGCERNPQMTTMALAHLAAAALPAALESNT